MKCELKLIVDYKVRRAKLSMRKKYVLKCDRECKGRQVRG